MTRTPRIRAGLRHLVKVGAVGSALALAACGFNPSGLNDGSDATDPDGLTGDDAATDGPGRDGPDPIDASPDAAAPSTFCQDDVGNLVVCMTFDDGNATNLATGRPQPSLAMISPRVGRVGQSAGFDAVDDVLAFAEAGDFDLGNDFAIELFVYYSQDPPTTGGPTDRRIGVVDNNGQYSIFLEWHQVAGVGPEFVTPSCDANGKVWGAPISRNAWHHVACVRSAGLLAIYTDGIVGDTRATSAPNTGSTDGLVFAQDGDSSPSILEDPLLGGLDEIRIWRAGRRPDQIFTAAGR